MCASREIFLSQTPWKGTSLYKHKGTGQGHRLPAADLGAENVLLRRALEGAAWEENIAEAASRARREVEPARGVLRHHFPSRT